MQKVLYIFIALIIAGVAILWISLNSSDTGPAPSAEVAVQETVNAERAAAAADTAIGDFGSGVNDGLAVKNLMADSSYVVASQKPVVATARDIAMVYMRFAGQMPNFDAWAEQTEEYKSTPDLEKLSAQKRIAREMFETFKLLTAEQPMLVDFTATLSDYNPDIRGYLVSNIRDDVFFPFTDDGKNYGVVAREITNYQWLPVDDLAQAKAIDDLRRQSASGREVVITFTLLPVKAEKDSAVMLNDKEYWMLGARATSAAIYDMRGQSLWQNTIREGMTEAQRKMLELYK